MPELRYYLVRQVREVQVAVNSPLEAATLASNVFLQSRDEIVVAEPGHRVLTQVREISLEVEEMGRVR